MTVWVLLHALEKAFCDYALAIYPVKYYQYSLPLVPGHEITAEAAMSSSNDIVQERVSYIHSHRGAQTLAERLANASGLCRPLLVQAISIPSAMLSRLEYPFPWPAVCALGETGAALGGDAGLVMKGLLFPGSGVETLRWAVRV